MVLPNCCSIEGVKLPRSSITSASSPRPLEFRRARRVSPSTSSGRLAAFIIATAFLLLSRDVHPSGVRAASSDSRDTAANAECPVGGAATLEIGADGSVRAADPASSEGVPALVRGELHDVDVDRRRDDGDDGDDDEADQRKTLDPDAWEDFSYWDLHAYFSCDAVFAGNLRIYDAADWIRLRRFYHSFVYWDEKENPRQEGDPDRTYQISAEAFDQPTTPFQTGKKGRGLKAARNLRRGELVFRATNNTVVFADGETWRAFLFALNDNYEVAVAAQATCDVLVWSWVQALAGDLAIVVDLDNGSLLNEGRDEAKWEAPNVRCGQDGDETCGMAYYTTRDVEEGEELLADYREFAMKLSWDKMGL